MYVVTHRGLFFWLTGLILAAAVGSILYFGLPLGMDFTGGSLMELQYSGTRPALSDIQKQVSAVPSVGAVAVREFGANGISIRTETLTPAVHEAILSAIAASSTAAGPVTELSYNSVGPALGSQFTHKAAWAIMAVILVIVLYIAFVFRKVSRPVPSWAYGLTTVAMLAIDIIVPVGFYAAYARYTGAEVDSLFVVALLALLGYVVNDIIVIFDRIREHLAKNNRENNKESFEITIGKSISETMNRSINTALTVALALLVLIFVGAPATRNFALVMLVGIVMGTFSSIARSAPLLIPIANWLNK